LNNDRGGIEKTYFINVNNIWLQHI